MKESKNRLLVSLGVLAFLVLVVVIGRITDAGYGKVSRITYELAKATYAACLAQDEDRLDAVKLTMDDIASEQPIPDQERRWLENILAKARKGNWESAAKDARRIMSDQVDH